jgi:hypothetical protein
MPNNSMNKDAPKLAPVMLAGYGDGMLVGVRDGRGTSPLFLVIRDQIG